MFEIYLFMTCSSFYLVSIWMGLATEKTMTNLSPLKLVLPSLPPATPSPVPLRPNQVALRYGRALGRRWWWLRLPTWVQVSLAVETTACAAPHEPTWGQTIHSYPQPPPPAEQGTGIKGASASPTCTLSQAPFVPCPPTHLCAKAAAAQMFSIKAWAMPASSGTQESAGSTGPPETPPPPLISANIFKC